MRREAGLLVVFAACLLPQVVCAQTYSKTETIEYEDNLNVWVLGQIKRTTTNGVEVSRITYDTVTGLPTAIYSFGALQQGLSYHDDGTVATLTDGNGNLTALDNYHRGIPQLITFPATPDQPSGTTTSAVVNDLGEIRSVTDARGGKTCYQYDGMGRVKLIQYPSETSLGQCGGTWADTAISFQGGYAAAYGLPAGHWRQRIVTGNQVIETLFDGLWRPVVKQTYDSAKESATLSQVVTRYDSFGNVAFASYPQRVFDTAISGTWGDPSQPANATGSTTLYDALNRVTSVTRSAEPGISDTTSNQYLPGFVTVTKDANGGTTTTHYQTYDEPSTDWPVRIDAPEGVTQLISRDPFGSPQSINQSGIYDSTEPDSVTKTITYDSYHRVCRIFEPETGSTVIGYDGANNVHSRAAGLNITGPGCGYEQVPTAAQIIFNHDQLNRLMSVAPPSDTQSTSYHYDEVGNATEVVSGNTAWSGKYNYRQMLTSETLDVYRQPTMTLGYGHDTNGHASSLGYPNGLHVEYAPDALGQPTKIGTFANQVTFAPDGSLQSFNYANGTTYLAQLNARQLISDFSYYTGSAPVVSEDFGYDGNGNILTVGDLADGPRTKSFKYDGLNRLSRATASSLWGTEVYGYDPLNNIRAHAHNADSFVYQYDATNRLTSITGAGNSDFRYDSRGNEIARGSSTLQFDALNQLTQIDGLANYWYDGAGRRVMKAPAGVSPSYYFYSHAGQLLFQLDTIDSTLAKTTSYVYLGSRLIARSEGTESTVPPPPVSSVTASVTGSTVLVSWASSSGATSYTLQQSRDGSPWSTVYSGSALSDAIAETVAGSYSFQVAACGTLCSPSTSSSAVKVAPPAAPTLTAPATNTSGSYTVSWGAVGGASSYTLEEQVNGTWSRVYTGSGTSSVISGKPNGSYGYHVEACNGVGCTWSAAATTVVTHPPATPSLSALGTNSSGTYSVTWGAVSTATSYSLSEQINGGVWNPVYTGSATTWSASGRAAGTYGYRVAACNTAGGCGGWSSIQVATVSIPITANGQSYTGYDAIALGAYGSAIVGFEILNAGTWEAFTSMYNNGVGGRQFSKATGTIPAAAVTVKYTWTLVGYPAGMGDAGGNVSNPASAPVAVSTNPKSTYTTSTWPQTAPDKGRTYQLRVDFYNAIGAAISSSIMSMTAETTGSP